MATTLENLEAARDALAIRIAELAPSMGPDVSDQGRSVSWTGYVKMLDALQKLEERINSMRPYVVTTRGRAV